jgi:hypothetical protein
MPTAARSDAYGRVVQTLRDLGPSKLLPREQDLIRDAADTLFFTEDVLADEAATEALVAIEDLTTILVEADRWSADRAEQLLSDVVACGPTPTRALDLHG